MGACRIGKEAPSWKRQKNGYICYALYKEQTIRTCGSRQKNILGRKCVNLCEVRIVRVKKVCSKSEGGKWRFCPFENFLQFPMNTFFCCYFNMFPHFLRLLLLL